MVKVLARIRKVTRKMKQRLHQIRRRKIRSKFNVIIAKSGVIMHLNVDPKECQGTEVMKLSLLKMNIKTQMKFFRSQLLKVMKKRMMSGT